MVLPEEEVYIDNPDSYYKTYLSAVKANLNDVESFRQIRRFVERHCPSNDRAVLDIGCGIGYLTDYLNCTAKAVGIDISEEAVETAKRLYPGVRFIKTDIICHDDGILDGKFDAVVCNNLVEHLQEEERASLFRKISGELLKDGGVVIFGYANPYHPVQLAWGFITRRVLFDRTHVHNWSVRRLKSTIAREFEIVETKRTSPFTRVIWLTKHFKGDIIVLAKKKG